MTILLLTLAAFSAFCIWLTVRIVNRRERWAKWTLAVTLCLPVLYVASFGPTCWLVDGGWVAARPIASVYRPILTAHHSGFDLDPKPTVMRTAIHWYGTLGARYDPDWIMPRLEDAAGLIWIKSGVWPLSTAHDVPHSGHDW